MATATSSKQMELEGSLGTFPLPDILRFMAMGHMTGVLTMAGSGREVELLIREGQLIGSHAPRRFLKLGQILVYAGALSRKDLEEVLDAQRIDPHHRMLGEMLTSRKLISREQVHHALEHQLKEELWELFSWNDGVFKFEHGVTHAMERALVSLPIEPLLEEGRRRMQQWTQIAQHYDHPQRVYRVRPDAAAAIEQRLTPQLWRVLSLVNGRHSTQMLVMLSGLGRFETLTSLEGLTGLGLIEPADRPAPRKTMPAAGEIQITRATKAQRHDNGSQHDRDDGGGLRGLFSRRRRQDGSPDSRRDSGGVDGRGPNVFRTDVGWACNLLNRMTRRLAQEFADTNGADPAGLAESVWLEVGPRFPRADLIAVASGTFDASRYDRFVELSIGLERAMAGCHEDAMAALAAAAVTLRRMARERLGARAETILRDITQPALDSLEIAWPAEFIAVSWLRQWLDEEE